MTGVKSGGDDDVAAFLQVCPQEDAAGVDVDGAGHLLLQRVHPVVPIQLHLGRDTADCHRLKMYWYPSWGGKIARTESTVPGDLEIGEPGKRVPTVLGGKQVWM